LPWSDQPIRFSKVDHLRKVPRPGHSPISTNKTAIGPVGRTSPLFCTLAPQ
jgi:hypothetical protein